MASVGFAYPIEHKFDFLALLAKFNVGALMEAVTHRVIDGTEVEYIDEVGQKVVANSAASLTICWSRRKVSW